MKHKQLWTDDKLERQEESNYLIKYLLKTNEEYTQSSFVLNINAEWGFGKTYFLNNFKKELENNHHKVIYFDAWSNDYTKEPLLAFIAKIDEEFSSCYESAGIKTKSIAISLFKSSLPLLISILTKQLTGMKSEEVAELHKQEDFEEEIRNENNNGLTSLMNKTAEIALKEHKTIGKSIILFKNNMQKLLKSIKDLRNQELPLFIIIDELDRCRPNYAIELLENIKHLFDISNIIFVVATDTKQLSHSINAIYGNKFESTRYLKRFFDKEYILRKPSNYNFIELKMSTSNLLTEENIFSFLSSRDYQDVNMNVKIVELYSDFFKLGLRDIEQCLTTLKAIVYTWMESRPIHLGSILFLIMLKQKFNYEFDYLLDNFNNGNIYNIVLKKIEDHIDNTILFKVYLNTNDKCTMNDILLEYHKLTYLNPETYSATFNNAGSSPINYLRRLMRVKLPTIQSYNRGDNYIVCNEFIDYPKLVLQGNRIV